MPAGSKRSVDSDDEEGGIVFGRKRKLNKNDVTLYDERGSYVEKVHGKAPSKERPALSAVIKTDLMKHFQKNMPLHDFFKQLNNPAYKKVLIEQRDSGQVRRGIIYDILSLEEIVYGLSACNTDLECIETLLKSSLVTKENYLDIYEQLSSLMVNVLYDQTKNAGAEATRRSTWISLLETHSWYTPVIGAELKASGRFRQDEYSAAINQKNKKEKITYAIRNIVDINDYRYLDIVSKVIKDVKKLKKNSTKWLDASIALIQASCGSRWIEVATVSTYTMSEINKFDPNLYIVVTGVAKETGKALSKFQKKYDEAVSSGKEDVLIELADTTRQDLIETIPDKLIVKPVLFSHFGITPEYIVTLSEDVQDYVRLLVPRNGMNDIQYRSAVAAKLYASSNDYFKKLWSARELRGFNNTTHTWRKLYASYSYQVYGGNGSVMNQQAWIEDVLGHTNLLTSFAYSNVVVTPSVKAQDPELRRMYVQLEERVRKLEDINQELRTENAFLRRVESDTISTETVSLPTRVDGEFVDVESFTGLKKRFKPDKTAEKEAFLRDAKRKIIERLEEKNVDIENLSDKEWGELQVPRDLGRVISKQFS